MYPAVYSPRVTLQTNLCKHCDGEFRAHESARTAKSGYCSGTCMVANVTDRNGRTPVHSFGD